MPPRSALDVWFRPKRFESERLYEQLGALLVKRYVPTGGDLVMRRLRRDHPGRRLVNSNLTSLCQLERGTRLAEFMHLIGFVGFTVLTASRVANGSLSLFGFTVASALNLILGLWPAVLQRYNRLRLYRAIDAQSHRRGMPSSQARGTEQIAPASTGSTSGMERNTRTE